MPRETHRLIATTNDRLTEQVARYQLQTSHALLFHTSGRELQLVTAHAVNRTRRGTPVIGPGRPLMPSDEREVLDLLTLRAAACDAGAQVFPERLLFRDAHRLAWWVPSAVRPMHLRTREAMTTIRTRWPSLVLLVMERTLYLAAVAGSERPGNTTRLYHAPLPNTYASSALCVGTAVLPVGSDIPDMAAWESVVFDTAFTHPNWDGGIAPSASGRHTPVDRYWLGRDAVESPFPGKRLVPLQQTLAQWMTHPKGRP